MTISNEYKIGLAVAVAVLILVFGINFLKGKSLFANDTEYIVYYEKVDGLNVGSNVLMRGFKIGVVKEISFVGETAESIKVKFIINEKLKFSQDSKVRIFSRDLMGTRGLDIVSGTSTKMKKNGDVFEGIVEETFKSEIGRQVAPLKNKAEMILSSIDSILVSVRGIINSDAEMKIRSSLTSVSKTLKNLQSTSVTLDNALKKETNSLTSIMVNVESITDNFKKSNEKISLLLSNAAAITDTINSSGLGKNLRNITESLENIKVITDKVASNNTSVGAMINNRELYNNLNETVSNLNRVVIDLEKNPKKYINFSVFGSSKSKKSKSSYAIVLFDSYTKVKRTKENEDLEEIFYEGRYFYILKMFKKNARAKSKLEKLKNTYPKAYIQKIN